MPATAPRPTRACPRLTALALLLAGALAGGAANAEVSYKLDRAQAGPGETISVQGVYVNNTPNEANWTAASRLVLQWRGPQGDIQRTLAYLDGGTAQFTVPVNNFASAQWKAVVPPGVSGLQAVSVEGEPVMMALDTSTITDASIAARPADVPITDAGVPGGRAGTGQPLPETALADTGRPVQAVGPAPTQVTHSMPASTSSNAAFDNFRNAISAHEPTYFIVGGRNNTDARFQISLKYRLFTPDDPANPTFAENLYLGYTQTALWDLEGDSRPFIDTTYNPSLFWRSDKVWESDSARWSLGMTAGVEHASNGKDGDDSRSYNDAFVEPSFNYRYGSGSTLSFHPKVKIGYFGVSEDNKDFRDYAGIVDWKVRWAQDNGLVLSALYRQGSAGHSTKQFDAAWPLRRTFLRMNGYLYAQYFNGYGETLLGYNQRNDSQFRIGLALVP
ncbi:Phospholipase A1 precursor,; Outer membrane phospholipase A [plant metagenome]|uniref:Phosphatidylcholine 1-acylhydrolase n=1 Tax=plant metagenome TaxID=1297885 RepID=A0A484SB83_9ZZZZ